MDLAAVWFCPLLLHVHSTSLCSRIISSMKCAHSLRILNVSTITPNNNNYNNHRKLRVVCVLARPHRRRRLGCRILSCRNYDGRLKNWAPGPSSILCKQRQWQAATVARQGAGPARSAQGHHGDTLHRHHNQLGTMGHIHQVWSQRKTSIKLDKVKEKISVLKAHGVGWVFRLSSTLSVCLCETGMGLHNAHMPLFTVTWVHCVPGYWYMMFFAGTLHSRILLHGLHSQSMLGMYWFKYVSFKNRKTLVVA